MTNNTAPTSEYLSAILWLGTLSNKGSVVPAGSGIVVHLHNQEYLATALHVAKACGYQPWVRRKSQWGSAQWETVGINQEADVAVLRASDARLSPQTPKYGLAGVLLGGVGRAMGFPAITDPEEISHVAEMNGRPLPLTTLVSAYLRPGTDAGSGIHYVGGYVNAGFSGGAMLLPTTEGWTIGGVITHKEGVTRNIYRRNAATGRFTEDRDLAFQEPSGLIRFAGFDVVTDLIERAPSQS